MADESLVPDTPEAELVKDDAIQGIPEEALNKLPPELKAQITLLVAQQRTGNINPLALKITPQHIDKLLEYSEEDSKRDHTEWKWDKISGGIYAVLFIALFVFVIVYLIDRKPEYILELIKYAAVFAGGFGLKSYLDNRNAN